MTSVPNKCDNMSQIVANMNRDDKICLTRSSFTAFCDLQNFRSRRRQTSRFRCYHSTNIVRGKGYDDECLRRSSFISHSIAGSVGSAGITIVFRGHEKITVSVLGAYCSTITFSSKHVKYGSRQTNINAKRC